MNGSDVYSVLKPKGVHTLHHANTVTTSCEYLRLGGLISRSFMENNNLPLTPQYSDGKDKQLGVWNDLFMDGIDIHDRASIPNSYGPVLFMLPSEILLSLPQDTEVWVTRSNPVHWNISDGQKVRYFQTLDDLRDSYAYGDFAKHIIIRNIHGFLPFNDLGLNILVDDPRRRLSNGADAFTQAYERLVNAARDRGPDVPIINQRQCKHCCNCLTGHNKSYDQVFNDGSF